MKVCGEHGCPELTEGAYCEQHTREPWARTGPKRSELSGSRQQQRARFVLERDEYICHVCGFFGATVADHVIPTAEGGADDVSNMAAIHVSCHEEKTKLEAQRGRRQA